MATDPKKIRLLYDEFGAEGYYKQFGNEYVNPHQAEVEALIRNNWPRLKVAGKVLDLAAGGGEVSKVLLALGHPQVSGCDPFTSELYTKQTGLPCTSESFKDIIKKGLSDKFDVIFCSFAMHLCPTKDLFSLCWQLFQASPRLVILSPHKRPALEELPNVRLEWEDQVMTERKKTVRMRCFSNR